MNFFQKDPRELNDLGVDCLIEIFKYLSEKELLSILLYDNRNIMALRSVYSIKFSKHSWFFITNDPLFNRYQKKRSLSLEYLRGFGCVINNLYFDYESTYHRFDKMIEKCLIKYCRGSLKTIKIKNAPASAMDAPIAPFENVTDVLIQNSKYSEFVSNFSEWFPNAKGLALVEMRYSTNTAASINIAFFQQKHPKLTEFFIRDSNVGNQNFINFIKLNPQLRMLSFACDAKRDGIQLNIELLSAIKTELKNLKHLHIWIRKGVIRSLATLTTKVHFNQLQMLSFENECASNIWKNIPITFGHVEYLVLNGKIYGCMEFIRQNRNIENLAIDKVLGRELFLDEFVDLAPELPLLKTIRLEFSDQINVLTIHQLLIECQHLNQLVFFINVYDDDPHGCANDALVFDCSDGKRWLTKTQVYNSSHYNRCLVYNRYGLSTPN